MSSPEPTRPVVLGSSSEIVALKASGMSAHQVLAPLITRVLPFRAFQPSDARFQNYYATDPERPFCRTYIEPKLTMLRRRYGADAVSPSASSADETARDG